MVLRLKTRWTPSTALISIVLLYIFISPLDGMNTILLTEERVMQLWSPAIPCGGGGGGVGVGTRANYTFMGTYCWIWTKTFPCWWEKWGRCCLQMPCTREKSGICWEKQVISSSFKWSPKLHCAQSCGLDYSPCRVFKVLLCKSISIMLFRTLYAALDTAIGDIWMTANFRFCCLQINCFSGDENHNVDANVRRSEGMFKLDLLCL